MIVLNNVSKKFNGVTACRNISLSVNEGCIYGIIGLNGSGKTTLLRLISGILKPSCGSITVDDLPAYDNPDAQSLIAYVSDDIYFPSGFTLKKLCSLYSALYDNFDKEAFLTLAKKYHLDLDKTGASMSKGMKRQAALLLGIARKTKYLIIDETFDGLDPIIRESIRAELLRIISNNDRTIIITTHNPREIEDLCDHLCVINNSQLITDSDIADIKENYHRVQVALPEHITEKDLTKANISNYTKTGNITGLIACGDENSIKQYFDSFSPKYLNIVSITLEEFFVYKLHDMKEGIQHEKQTD